MTAERLRDECTPQSRVRIAVSAGAAPAAVPVGDGVADEDRSAVRGLGGRL